MRVQRSAKPLGMRGHRGSSHSPVEADIGVSNVTEELQTALICAQEILRTFTASYGDMCRSCYGVIR